MRIATEELRKSEKRCIFSAWEIASKNLARSREADGKLNMCPRQKKKRKAAEEEDEEEEEEER